MTNYADLEPTNTAQCSESVIMACRNQIAELTGRTRECAAIVASLHGGLFGDKPDKSKDEGVESPSRAGEIGALRDTIDRLGYELIRLENEITGLNGSLK